MAKKVQDKPDRAADLLEKLLVFQLHALGTPQHRIAKVVGRRRAWVDQLVRGVPRRGQVDGGET